MRDEALDFGLLRYPTSINLGDEIQSIAARQWLPRVDRLIDREALHRDPGGAPVGLFLNGWFMHRPQNWPPHPRIIPFPISIHLTDERPGGRIGRLWRAPPTEKLMRAGAIDYFHQHGPIGARDMATLELLQRHGVDAYFSGCLTLTLERQDGVVRGDDVVVCDVEGEPAAALRRSVRSPLIWTGHHESGIRDPHARLARAAELLLLYSRAKAVVTTRLHCALPCLALGTPVLLVTPGQCGRMELGRQLAHHCYPEQLSAGVCAFDPDNPPANPPAYLALRNGLIDQCRAFVMRATQPHD